MLPTALAGPSRCRWKAFPCQMALDPQLDASLLADFKAQLNQSRLERPEAWESSSRLVGQARLRTSLTRLSAAIQGSSFPPSLREALIAGLRGGAVERVQELPAEQLKRLTGLPATKALRALCVLFGVAAMPAAPIASITPLEIETLIRANCNPFDLLLQAEVASLLDLGAGDLSFAVELAERYLPLLAQHKKPLTLHCVDRVPAGSKLGAAYQADPQRLAALRGYPSSSVQFQYWGNQDMFDLGGITKILPCYTIVTCHAPATPTVAYEPSRLSPSIIESHLRKTKGDFRKVRVEGEEALEVLHEGQSLLFPPWKFEIKGPLALLNIMADKGKLCVLGAVDNEVFWEILAQLLADARYRPSDLIFTPSNLPEVFGSVYDRLSALPVGQAIALADLADLRPNLPHAGGTQSPQARPAHFRYVGVRRGAVFEGQPASRTARLFKDMKEEATPWTLTLVPGEGHP